MARRHEDISSCGEHDTEHLQEYKNALLKLRPSLLQQVTEQIVYLMDQILVRLQKLEVDHRLELLGRLKVHRQGVLVRLLANHVRQKSIFLDVTRVVAVGVLAQPPQDEVE